MTNKPKLTDRQIEVLDFIRTFKEREGFSPTFREIGAELGITSTNGVKDHLLALERKGVLTFSAGTARSIVLPDQTEERSPSPAEFAPPAPRPQTEQSLIPSATETTATAAVTYLLDRIQVDPELRYHMLGTEAMERLIAVEATATGRSIEDVRFSRERDLQPFHRRRSARCLDDQARVYLLESELHLIVEQQDIKVLPGSQLARALDIEPEDSSDV